MKGGQRWPPNPGSSNTAPRRSVRFNEGRPALAAEYHRFGAHGSPLRASMKGGQRWPPNLTDTPTELRVDIASMKGGQRWPPNHMPAPKHPMTCSASMKGGQRWPPNGAGRRRGGERVGASMKGGQRWPPNGSPTLRRMSREFARGIERSVAGVPLECFLSRSRRPKTAGQGHFRAVSGSLPVT